MLLAIPYVFFFELLFTSQLIPLHLPPGDTTTERNLHIDGTKEQIEAAKQLVDEVTSEVCMWVCSYLYSLLVITRLYYLLIIAKLLLNAVMVECVLPH